MLSILLEAYIDVPPMYFPVPGHPLGNENILLSCPPPVLHNTWGGHDSRKFLVSCPPPCIEQYRGGHEIALFLLISGTLSFQALIELITM